MATSTTMDTRTGTAMTTPTNKPDVSLGDLEHRALELVRSINERAVRGNLNLTKAQVAEVRAIADASQP